MIGKWDRPRLRGKNGVIVADMILILVNVIVNWLKN